MKRFALLLCLTFAAAMATDSLMTGLMGSWAFDGNGTDASGNGNTAVLTGAGVTYGTGKFGQCLLFAGTAHESVDCGNSTTLNAPNGMTVCFWMTIDTTGGFDPGSNPSRIIDKFASPCIYFGPSCHIYDGNGDDLNGDNPPVDPIAGALHHYAIVFDTTKDKIYAYQDTVLYDSGTLATGPLVTEPTAHLSVGNRLSDAARMWKGKIDALHIWGRPISYFAIRQDYHGWAPGGGGTTSTSGIWLPFMD